MTLAELNGASPAAFVTALDGIFEHAPWVAERAVGRPFADAAALHAALMQALRSASDDEIRAFLNGHPELAADKIATDLTPESTAEQRALGMAGTDGAADLHRLNAAHRDRFGIPFIICVARHSPANVLRQLHHRLTVSPDLALAAALDEVGHITRLRLAQRIDGAAPPSGRLSCHVLDVAAGKPAQGIAVELRQEGRAVATDTTDADGRIGPGLLAPGPLRQGIYELVFAAGAYFAARGTATFYDTIPVRFVVSESEGHYHIPLLLAPFAYSTYRGS